MRNKVDAAPARIGRSDKAPDNVPFFDLLHLSGSPLWGTCQMEIWVGLVQLSV